VVLDKLRKGLRNEPQVVTLLKGRQWSSDSHRKDLVERFLALPSPAIEDLVWTATDQNADIRSAGLQLLKKQDRAEVLEALVPLLRTRSEAVRRAVQRFVKEIAGEGLADFLTDLSVHGDDFARLSVLDLAREIPADKAFAIFKKVLADPHPVLRARALRAVSETSAPGTSALAANLALPMLQDEDEEIRLAALQVLERNPSEALIKHVLAMARSGGGRVLESAFATLRKLLPVSQEDHTPEILPLLADGNLMVRVGAVSLLQQVPVQQLGRHFTLHFAATYSWVRDRALEAASKGIPNFIPALLDLTHSPEEDVARAASEMSLNLADARAIPSWLALLDAPDWWVKSRALECLGKYGGAQQGIQRDAILQRLLAALRDPELTLPAASALGDLGDPRSAATLFELFKGSMSRPDDQIEFLDALAKLAPKEPKVAPIVAKISTLPEIDVAVREKARRLVGKLQGEEARDALPKVVAEPKKVDISTTPSPKIVDFLADTIAYGASDFHLATGFVPHRRIHGQLERLNVPRVTPEQAEKLIREVLSPDEWQHLLTDRQIDLCLKVPGLGRFRANFFSQRGGLDASFRAIPANVPTLEDVGLPESVWEVTKFTQGLVLVTGPAGCGKSTTLAALVDRVNESRTGHIITVEDPVEFVHPNKECLVNQRQVPSHTASFARALKAALREDPDVIMVGEMRDLDTIALAISASETGHLVFGTLSTTTASGTVDRIINSFPAGQQGQIRTMVSESLKAVISQALLPRRGGYGRVAAFEILRGTTAVASLIREAKTFQLPSSIQTGQLSGMMTMDQSLLKLVEEGKIDPEAALDRAVKKEPFEKILSEERLAFE
jgi:twitching motility protein PilT